MTNCLLDWFQFEVGEGAFYALFGFLIVFAGIVILILLFTALGKIMEQVNKPHKQRKPRKSKKKEDEIPEGVIEQAEDGVTPELVAVISAAVAAVYESENVKCDFVVKRIRKL
ncbi:MAG: OadG family protein [Clostridia bacterium]|nr:OadG family protein [Clostridia bacterium]